MPTNTGNPFNAIEWLSSRHPSLSRLVCHQSQSLLHFALMWNMFEGELCDTSASISKLKSVARFLAERDLLSHPSAMQFLQFVRGRYWFNNEVTSRFDTLRFRTPQESQVVTAALCGTTTDSTEIIFALLLIVYRYRNNTFHGLKEISEVLSSPELFEESARFLSATLELG